MTLDLEHRTTILMDVLPIVRSRRIDVLAAHAAIRQAIASAYMNGVRDSAYYKDGKLHVAVCGVTLQDVETEVQNLVQGTPPKK